MKFFVSFAALVLASSMSLAATSSSKKIKKVIYEDGTSSKVEISQPRRSDSTRVFRRVGAVVGLNMADTTIKTDGTRTGFIIGGMVDLLGQSNWVLETGLQYRQQGTSGMAGLDGTTGNSFNLNYISLPIAAKYYFSEQSGTGFFAKGGTIIGLNVSATRTVNGQSQDVGKDVNTFDLGLIVGGGGKFSVSPSVSVLVELDYMRGLTNILNYKESTGVISVNNVGIAFMSGVAFEL